MSWLFLFQCHNYKFRYTTAPAISEELDDSADQQLEEPSIGYAQFGTRLGGTQTFTLPINKTGCARTEGTSQVSGFVCYGFLIGSCVCVCVCVCSYKV